MRYSIILVLATTAIAAPVAESPLDRTCPNQHDLFEKLSTNSEELRDPAVNKAAFRILEACCDAAAFNIPEMDPLCSLKPLNKRQRPERYCTTIAESYECVNDGTADPLKCYDMLFDCCAKSKETPGFNLALDPICTVELSSTKLATLPISAESAVAKRQEDSVCLATKESCLKEGSTLETCLLKTSDCCIATKSTERVCHVEFGVTTGPLSAALNPQVIQPKQEDYVCLAVGVECQLENPFMQKPCLDKIFKCCIVFINTASLCEISSSALLDVLDSAVSITADAIVNEASQGK